MTEKKFEMAGALAGTLFIVPTPIGNLEDITLRALKVLKNVDFIICEDSRRTGQLLSFYEIEKKLLLAHEHNEKNQLSKIMDLLATGKSLALVSDAGMPLLSDPGFQIINECYNSQYEVEVLPGASAITTALVMSALPPLPFSFFGFLPTKKTKREKQLKQLLELGHTVICFESPHRIESTLFILHQLDPERRICVLREMTKKFEERLCDLAMPLLQHFNQKEPKGEFTLVF